MSPSPSDFHFPYRNGLVAFQKVGSRKPWNGLTSSHRLCDESGDESVADATIRQLMWNCRNFTLFFNFRRPAEGGLEICNFQTPFRAPAGRSGNGFHFFSRLESSRCNFRFAVQPSDRMETGSCQLFFPGWPLGRVSIDFGF